MHSIPPIYSKVSDNFLLNYFFHSTGNGANSNNFIFLCEYINPVLAGKTPAEPQENRMAAALPLAKVK